VLTTHPDRTGSNGDPDALAFRTIKGQSASYVYILMNQMHMTFYQTMSEGGNTI
jgi:hypothetical protein